MSRTSRGKVRQSRSKKRPTLPYSKTIASDDDPMFSQMEEDELYNIRGDQNEMQLPCGRSAHSSEFLGGHIHHTGDNQSEIWSSCADSTLSTKAQHHHSHHMDNYQDEIRFPCVVSKPSTEVQNHHVQHTDDEIYDTDDRESQDTSGSMAESAAEMQGGPLIETTVQAMQVGPVSVQSDEHVLTLTNLNNFLDKFDDEAKEQAFQSLNCQTRSQNMSQAVAQSTRKMMIEQCHTIETPPEPVSTATAVQTGTGEAGRNIDRHDSNGNRRDRKSV